MRKTGMIAALCAGAALVFPGGTTVAIAQLAPDAPSRADPAQETATVVLPSRSRGAVLLCVGSSMPGNRLGQAVRRDGARPARLRAPSRHGPQGLPCAVAAGWTLPALRPEPERLTASPRPLHFAADSGGREKTLFSSGKQGTPV